MFWKGTLIAALIVIGIVFLGCGLVIADAITHAGVLPMPWHVNADKDTAWVMNGLLICILISMFGGAALAVVTPPGALITIIVVMVEGYFFSLYLHDTGAGLIIAVLLGLWPALIAGMGGGCWTFACLMYREIKRPDEPAWPFGDLPWAL